jgi:hypothetical protein
MRPFLVVLLLITAGASQVNADTIITYELSNYAGIQSGYSLSGSVTVDLTTDAITAWNFSMTNGTNTYSSSSTDPGAQIQFSSNPFTATATTLTINSGAEFGFHDNTGDTELLWDNNFLNDGYWYYSYTGSSSNYLWDDLSSSSSALDPLAPSFVIGTAEGTSPTPEPATITLLGVGIAGLAGYHWRRRRQSTVGGLQLAS